MGREAGRRRTVRPHTNPSQALPLRRTPLAAPDTAASSGAGFQLCLLGPFQLWNGSHIGQPLPRKAQGLLAYLALQRGRPVLREKLAELLWGRSGGEHARRSLRQCLMSVRAALGNASDALQAKGDGVLLDFGRSVHLDLDAFETLAASGEASALERACATYRGEFLAGLDIPEDGFSHWMLVERRRLASRMSDALHRLALARSEAGNVGDAIAAAERLTALDPLREDGHRLLIELLARTGRRSDALKQHEACVERLRRDLGVAPEAETARLIERIKDGSVAPGTDTAKASGVGGPKHEATAKPAQALPLPDKPSIAVMAFNDLNAGGDDDYFTDGMVEDITIALGRVPWLFVIASSSAFSYRKADVEVRRVGAELGVRYVLRGSVRRSGERIRIVVQLIDASRGAHIWADRFDGQLDDFFELQDRVATQVAATIAPTLHAVEIERARRKPPESLTAYELYLQAVPRFRTNLAENRAAIGLLRRAIEIDPGYGAAYGFASRCYQFQKLLGWVPLSEPELEEGVRLGHHAADIGQNDSEALWMAGLALTQLSGEVERGAALIDRSLTLNPNSANAWLSSCNLHTYLGEPDVAVDHFYRAQRLNPLDTVHHIRWNMLSMALLGAGRLDDAEEAADKSLSAAPKYPPGLRMKIALCGLHGKIPEGKQHVRRLLAINPFESVGWLQGFWGPIMMRTSGTLARIIEGARLAGLPESRA